MLFTQPSFLFLFLPVLLALYFLPVRSAAYRNVLLVLASALFYARGGGLFTWLVFALIVFNYGAAIAIDRRRGQPSGRRLLAATVGCDLVVLGVFKYADFAVGNVNALAGIVGAPLIPLPHLLLPIGISFFTFHAVSYVVDVYRRDATAQKGPIEAALYLLLFPQLIAGPIIRYREIATQLTSRVVTLDGFASGARRFVVGLAKKVLIANVVAVPADAIFRMAVPELTPAHAWLGVVCYTLQIYFDFSGYSDMAIGLGALFGFRFPENFNYPYIASSVQDFWRRWHMSLSRWFRDYVYVPLGGNRVSTGRTYVNLVAVFFLCGLWHGASWTYVVWGLFHGAFLVIERPRARGRGPHGPLAHVYTLLVVMVGWVFFRADSLAHAGGMLSAMAGVAGRAPTAFDVSWYLNRELLIALAAAVIGSTPMVRTLGDRTGPGMPAYGWVQAAAMLVLFAAAAMFIAAGSYDPFIYFRF